jgi:transposase
MSIRRASEIWFDQCQAARDIKRRFGVKAAVDYVVAEKLLNFASMAARESEFARELPQFVLQVTAGNINDITVAARLIDRAGPIRHLLADKAYDANHLRRLLAKRRIKAVIPSTASRTRPIAYDRVLYKERNRIERLWCRLKDWHRIATRYDNLARNYLSAAYLAASLTCWIN